jgi:diguanylate cyclase (GGDEF)-like protein/PAS domain S-box-containing protein
LPTPPRKSDNTYDLEKFFNFAIDLFCIADTKGFFRRVNPAFTRLLGYEADELLTQPFVELVHPDDREQTLAEVGKLASGQLTLSFENRFRCKDGSYKYLHWTSYPESKTGLLYAVARDITDRKQREDRVDGITGAPNRRVWDDNLKEEWRRAGRLEVPLAVAFIDVDHLRAYNDEWGHLDGDKALRRVAEVLSDHLRRSGDLVARYHGGTFGLIFAGGLEVKQAEQLCERMRADIHTLNLNHPKGIDERLTVSGGVAAHVPSPDRAPDPLTDAAANALATAKGKGRNRIARR